MTAPDGGTPLTDAVDVTNVLPHLRPARGRSDWPMQYAKIIGHARKMERDRERLRGALEEISAAVSVNPYWQAERKLSERGVQAILDGRAALDSLEP